MAGKVITGILVVREDQLVSHHGVNYRVGYWMPLQDNQRRTLVMGSLL